MREGLFPQSASVVASLVADEARCRRLAALAGETLDPENVAASAFERPGETGPGAGWIAEIYFGDAPDEASVRTLVATLLDAETAAALTFHIAEPVDWVAASLAGLNPVEAGRFVVHGRHDRERLRAGAISVEIEAALAFGTGHHGTTRACLLMLDRILRQRRPRRMLDVGTGTGVLAIAAAKATRRAVACGDVDTDSVRLAAENARLNGVAGLVRPVVAAGTNHAQLRRRRGHDLVFANILARPLMRLAPTLAAALAPGGDLVLSGLLSREAPAVLASYRAQGLALADRIDLDGWACLRLRRGGLTQRSRPSHSTRNG